MKNGRNPANLEVTACRRPTMPEPIGYEEVQNWLDQNVVDGVEQEPTRDAQFQFIVSLAGYKMTVFKVEREGPLRITCHATLPADRILALIERQADRRHIATLFATTFANTSGLYTYLDDEGEACEFDDLRTIRFEAYIYPDEASQSRLMHQLFEITRAMTFVSDTLDYFENSLKDQS